MEKGKSLKNEKQKPNYKAMEPIEGQGILQIILIYKRKEQNNTKQWIQQKIKIYIKQTSRNFNENCAVTIYSLFYSVVKTWSYWDLNTRYPMLLSVAIDYLLEHLSS